MSKMIIKIVLLTIVLIVVGFFVSGPIFTNSETKEKIGQLGIDENIRLLILHVQNFYHSPQ